MALLMAVAIVEVAIMWGCAEALTGTIIGGPGFDYYFLPPDGFGIAAPVHWVAPGAFLLTAIVTGQLAARPKQRGIEAAERKAEIEKLYRLANAMLSGRGPEFSLAQLADQLVEIFRASGVALFDQHTGHIVRSGPSSTLTSDQALRETATRGPRLRNADSAFFLTPILHGTEIVGSIALNGAMLAEQLLNAVAERVGFGLARLDAIEGATEIVRFPQKSTEQTPLIRRRMLMMAMVGGCRK